jgi:hypothetical protein
MTRVRLVVCMTTADISAGGGDILDPGATAYEYVHSSPIVFANGMYVGRYYSDVERRESDLVIEVDKFPVNITVWPDLNRMLAIRDTTRSDMTMACNPFLRHFVVRENDLTTDANGHKVATLGFENTASGRVCYDAKFPSSRCIINNAPVKDVRPRTAVTNLGSTLWTLPNWNPTPTPTPTRDRRVLPFAAIIASAAVAAAGVALYTRRSR